MNIKIFMKGGHTDRQEDKIHEYIVDRYRQIDRQIDRQMYMNILMFMEGRHTDRQANKIDTYNRQIDIDRQIDRQVDVYEY